MAVSQTPPSVLNIASLKRTSEKLWLPVWRDRNDNPIANSFEQLPVKPHYECYAIAVYDIEIFKPYSDAAFKNEIDSLNSGSWRSWDAYQAWISEIHSDGVDQIGDDTGERVNYIIRCIKRTDGWKFQHPDVGYIYNDGDVRSFLSTDGFPYIGKLDSGGKLADATPMTILIENIKEEIDFSSLGV